MSFIDQLTNYVIQFTVIMVIILAFLVIIGYYFIKVKKVPPEKLTEMDYSSFNHSDSMEYVKFDDIVSDNEGNGMLVMDNGTRFVASLKTEGSDFFSATAGEQLGVMGGMVAFENTIDRPITFRQSSKKLDLRDNIETHEQLLENTKIELVTVNDEYEDLLEISKKVKDKEYEVYYKRLIQLQKKIKALDFRRVNLEAELSYMKSMSENSVALDMEMCWIYDWTYNPKEYTRELTKEQIYKKAMAQLANKGNSMRSSLSRCNVSADRMSGEELLEQIRRHNNPISSEMFRMKEVLGSAFNEIVITSDSANELVEDYIYELESSEQPEQENEEDIKIEAVENLLNLNSSVNGSNYEKGGK